MDGHRGRCPRQRNLDIMAKPTLSKNSATDVVSLKVTLRSVKPPIWRRLLMLSTMMLGDLHQAIQAAMGWRDGYLHAFDIDGQQYGDRHTTDDLADENRLTLVNGVLSLLKLGGVIFLTSLRLVVTVAAGGAVSVSIVRSRSTMVSSASAVGLLRRLSGSASSQVAYSACSASSSSTALRQRSGRLRRSVGRRVLDLADDTCVE